MQKRFIEILGIEKYTELITENPHGEFADVVKTHLSQKLAIKYENVGHNGIVRVWMENRYFYFASLKGCSKIPAGCEYKHVICNVAKLSNAPFACLPVIEKYILTGELDTYQNILKTIFNNRMYINNVISKVPVLAPNDYCKRKLMEIGFVYDWAKGTWNCDFKN